jgi:SAM-dependent methyltransferase
VEARGGVIAGKSTGCCVEKVRKLQQSIGEPTNCNASRRLISPLEIGSMSPQWLAVAVVNFFDRWILAPIIDLVMRQSQLEKYRREVVAAASGCVLEVGVGSGLNFSLYGKQVETVVGIDPSPRLLAIARRRADAAGIRAEFLQGSATAIPLAESTSVTNSRDLGGCWGELVERPPPSWDYARLSYHLTYGASSSLIP